MKKFSAFLAAVLVFFSCAGVPHRQNDGFLSVIPEETAKLPAEIPESFGYIMGNGIASPEELAAFLLQINNQADREFVLSLADYYREEAVAEGVNHDMAFVQMCLETGFLRYGGLVTPDMNNFCGLGAIGPEETGLFFPDPRTGVRAHIQHLQAYASTEPLKQELVDPRYRYVKRGIAPSIHGLTGTWAADRSYDEKIARILKNLYEFSSDYTSRKDTEDTEITETAETTESTEEYQI
jgi:hypothetical protein